MAISSACQLELLQTAEAVARATVRAVLTARALHLNDGLRLPCHADMVSTGG